MNIGMTFTHQGNYKGGMMKSDYTLAERLEMTIGNIKFQENKIYWDDIEKLELILKALKKMEVNDGN